MEYFEIHITGDESIHSQAIKLGIKTIEVSLMNPNTDVIRTEHMTSHTIEAENLYNCVLEVNKILSRLKGVVRTKIECPYNYSHYHAKSLYVEAHFKPIGIASCYPQSSNKRGNLIATDRTYNKNEYETFFNKWKGQCVEVCLYDDAPYMDDDWFLMWKKENK